MGFAAQRPGRFRYLLLPGLLVVVLGWIDVLTGYELSFSIFYLAPIAIAAWLGGRSAGLGISVMSAVTMGVADALSNHQYSSDLFYVWNSLIRLGFFTIVTYLVAELQRAHAREATLARTDALTGLANGRHFRELVDVELSRSRRYRRPLSLAYVDLDNFKHVNDTEGHAAGDSLLQALAESLRQQLRDADTAARMGGDEFAVLLPETGPEAAAAIARRVHRALGDTASRSGYGVSASIGVVTCRSAPPTRDELLHLADELMYSVKRSSKNTVACTVYDRREAAAS